MQEETKRHVILKTDYDRLLVKSLQKKRLGGSPTSYIEQIDMPTSSSDAKKKQTDVPTSSTYVASGLNAHERALAMMPTEQLAQVISFQEETGLPLDALLGNAEPPPPDKNFVPRWPFELGQPLIRSELVKKLPTKMHKFHQWYMTMSNKERERFGMLVRPDDFSSEGEKVVWLEFRDIYEI